MLIDIEPLGLTPYTSDVDDGDGHDDDQEDEDDSYLSREP